MATATRTHAPAAGVPTAGGTPKSGSTARPREPDPRDDPARVRRKRGLTVLAAALAPLGIALPAALPGLAAARGDLSTTRVLEALLPVASQRLVAAAEYAASHPGVAWVLVEGSVLLAAAWLLVARAWPRVVLLCASVAGMVVFPATCLVGARLAWFDEGWAARVLPGPSEVAAVEWAACAVALFYFFSHVTYLAWRFVVEPPWRARRAVADNAHDLLADHESVVESVVGMIEARGLGPPMVIALSGNQGAGKSTIVRKLLYRLQAPGQGKQAQCAVYVDAWQHQAESSLEATLYLEISRHWDALLPVGWLVRPIFRVLPYALRRLMKLSINLGQVVAAEVGPQTLMPPPIWWKRLLQRTADDLRRRRKRLVVVLDEVDRCTPEAVQTYLGLISRFLSVTNVTVIVPYVPDQIRFKAFHPVLVHMFDQRATIDAFLHCGLFDRAPDGRRAAELARVIAGSGDKPDGTQKEGASPRPAALDHFRRLGAAAFVSLPPARRRRFFERMEEKAFGAQRVSLPPLSPTAVREVLQTFDSVQTVIARYGLDTGERQMLAEAGARWWAALQNRSGAERATLRDLTGRLTEQLSEFATLDASQVRPPAGAPPSFNPRLLLAGFAVNLALRRLSAAII